MHQAISFHTRSPAKKLMKKINTFVISIILSVTVFAAEWTQIYEHPDGVKWYGTSAEKVGTGIQRVYVKPIHPKRNPEPIALLLDCKKKSVRNYVAGQFGTEFFEPWQPITPDSIGEISYSWYCKK